MGGGRVPHINEWAGTGYSALLGRQGPDPLHYWMGGEGGPTMRGNKGHGARLLLEKMRF